MRGLEVVSVAAVNRAPYFRPKKSKQIGLCKYHSWFLSWPQVRNYGCLHKKREGGWCPHFRPNLRHSFWGERKIPENIRRKIELKVAQGGDGQSV